MAKSKHATLAKRHERIERTIANYERSLHRLALALKAIREQVLLEWDY